MPPGRPAASVYSFGAYHGAMHALVAYYFYTTAAARACAPRQRINKVRLRRDISYYLRVARDAPEKPRVAAISPLACRSVAAERRR